MTKKPKGQDSPVHIDLGARAEAKLEIKATVPASSMGRFVDAITDLFRPYSEARGLRADQIRLQREEVAIKIAQLARLRSEAETAKLVLPPFKVLIPLFEKASQEELHDDFMLNRWADLLVSASSPASVPPRFVAILGELSGAQARMFMEIATKGVEETEDANSVLNSTSYDLEQPHIEKALDELLKGKNLSVQDVYDELLPVLDVPGGALVDIMVNSLHGLSTTEYKFGSVDLQSHLQILASLGLIRYVYFNREKNKGEVQRVSVIYYHITDMGCEFFKAVSPREGR